MNVVPTIFFTKYVKFEWPLCEYGMMYKTVNYMLFTLHRTESGSTAECTSFSLCQLV